MSEIEVVREERDRFGRVHRSRLRYAVEFDPAQGLYRSQLLPGCSVHRERRVSHVVALGGGTGLPVVLMGLRRHLPKECRITAVVTAADDGGSSGILREIGRASCRGKSVDLGGRRIIKKKKKKIKLIDREKNKTPKNTKTELITLQR